MAITITETEMASDQTPHTAVLIEGGWLVSWLPDRVLTRDQAITAITIAEAVGVIGACADLPGTFTEAFITAWAAELGISAGTAITEASLTPAQHGILGNRKKGIG